MEARRSDWTTDPFQLVEKDGYFYGRGTQDMKIGDAILITDLIRFIARDGARIAISSWRSPPTKRAGNPTASTGC